MKQMDRNSSEEDLRSERGISRRKLLMVGAGSAAAIATNGLLVPAGAAAEDEVSDLYGPSVNGLLKERSPGNVVIEDYHLSLDWTSSGMPTPRGSEVSILVGDDATLYRDGPCQLTDFQPGDRVVAFVRSEGDVLVAVAVEPTYTTVEGKVSGLEGSNRLNTSAGIVVLHDETSFRASPASPGLTSAAQISRGDQIEATCRIDSSGDLIAANIGVV